MIAMTIVLALAAGWSRAGSFQPRHLAVLRAGDGEMDLKLRQSPAFIDEFATGVFNPAPLSTVPIPTIGPNALFFNGHAATEGILTRSADGRYLTFAGYGGVNLLQSNGTPSVLVIDRGFSTVDAAGAVHTTIYGKEGSAKKMNPRGIVSDGSGNFWGCGNAGGTVYYNPGRAAGPVQFADIPDSRAIKIVNHVLYTTLNGPDGIAHDVPAGGFLLPTAKGLPRRCRNRPTRNWPWWSRLKNLTPGLLASI